MTIWKPEIRRNDGPIYLAIADAIAEAIETGGLEPGERLPTHRELADDLRVALTTVTRGYGEAERRGLVVGEVGRGTFVRRPDEPTGELEEPNPKVLDLTANVLLPHGLAQHLTTRMGAIIAQGNPWAMLDYQPHAGRLRQRTAGALWMERAGVAAPPDRVLLTAGAQHAMAVAFGTLANPGDTVLCEELTYSGMKQLAHQLHIRLRGIPMDDDGLLPDAFEAACREGGAKALYTMPTLHNPRGIVMSEGRRREIARIADRYRMPVVEDDSYGFLVPEVKPMAAFSENIYYLCGTSKSIAPSLRVGYIRAPGEMVDRLTAAINSTVYMTSSTMAEVVTEWIFDGTADRVMRWKRTEVAARQELTHRLLGRFGYRGHPMSQLAWVELPDPWGTDEFVAQAKMRGVLVCPADFFVVGRTEAPYAIRIAIGAVPTHAALERGLLTLTEILDHPREPGLAVV